MENKKVGELLTKILFKRKNKMILLDLKVEVSDEGLLKELPDVQNSNHVGFAGCNAGLYQ